MARSLGEIIENERVKRGWSQAELAKRIDRSASQVSRIESGDRSTDVDTLGALVRVLELDPGEAIAAAAAHGEADPIATIGQATP